MFFIKIEVVFIAYCLKKIWRGKKVAETHMRKPINIHMLLYLVYCLPFSCQFSLVFIYLADIKVSSSRCRKCAPQNTYCK